MKPAPILAVELYPGRLLVAAAAVTPVSLIALSTFGVYGCATLPSGFWCR